MKKAEKSEGSIVAVICFLLCLFLSKKEIHRFFRKMRGQDLLDAKWIKKKKGETEAAEKQISMFHGRHPPLTLLFHLKKEHVYFSHTKRVEDPLSIDFAQGHIRGHIKDENKKYCKKKGEIYEHRDYLRGQAH